MLARARVAPLWLLPLLHACASPPTLRDGFFRCDPDDPGSCPAGSYCLRPSGALDHRCFAEPLAAAYCGNEIVEEGEECDGPLGDAASCRTLGYFDGELSCSAECTIDRSSCRSLRGIAAAAYSACALDDAGEAWCWGRKDMGQLGGAYVRSGASPIAAVGLSGLSSLAAGASHVCGLGPKGELYCWGDNGAGQLGGGVEKIQPLPLRIPAPQLTQLAAGHSHTCGLDASGAATCWGLGASGQLGTSLSAHRFRRIHAGAAHSCGIDEMGRAWCWGLNGFGQLGDGGTSSGPKPRAVGQGVRFKALALGYLHSCGLSEDGRTLCWGRNTAGQLGREPADNLAHPVPAPVEGAPALLAIAAGTRHSCGLDAQGEAWCWGYGQLAGGAASPKPLRAAPGQRFVALAAGNDFSCGETGRTVVCWGWNGSWQLGRERSPGPRPVVGDQRFSRICAGIYHTCALDLEGAAWCWGYNGRGSLGDGSFDSSERPKRTKHAGAPFVELACGVRHTCAIDSDRRAWCWGENTSQQVGASGSELVVPTLAVPASLELERIAAGVVHSCGIDPAGQAWCWGANAEGQLGRATGALAPVAGGHHFQALALGRYHSCGLDTDGAVWCWGRNTEGQLGTGTSAHGSMPLAVAPGRRYLRLVAGEYHTCAAGEGGGLECWGDNRSGQLGLGSPAPMLAVPTPVSLAPSVAALSASYLHTCALDGSGQIWCWGTGREGQLGTGSEVVFVPEPVRTELRFRALGVSFSQSCGIDLESRAWCWGENGDGQLGVDDFLPSPAAILPPRPPDAAP